jgi:hypothetical protein
MPEISRFFGIIITIYMEVEEVHQIPHFHVRYGEYRASYSIDPIAQLAGALPRRQQRLVEAWAEMHQAELVDNWLRIQNGRSPVRIRGLE